jgi:hypothetical protein
MRQVALVKIYVCGKGIFGPVFCYISLHEALRKSAERPSFNNPQKTVGSPSYVLACGKSRRILWKTCGEPVEKLADILRVVNFSTQSNSRGCQYGSKAYAVGVTALKWPALSK